MLKESRLNMELSFSGIIAKIFENIIGFICIFLACIFISVFYSAKSDNIFEVKSLLQLDKKSNNLLSPSSGGVIFDFGNNNLNEQSHLYLSRTNLLELVVAMKLNYEIDGENYDFSQPEFFEDVIIISDNAADFNLNLSEDNFTIIDSVGQKKSFEYNVPNLFGGDEITIYRESGKNYINQNLSVVYSLPQNIIKSLKSNFFVTSVGGNITSRDSLFEIVFITKNRKLGRKVLDNMNMIYIENSVKKNSTEALSSVKFIENQIEEIRGNLRLDTEKLNDFRTSNLLVRESEESKAYFSALTRLDTSITDLTLKRVELLNTYEPESQIVANIESQLSVLQNEKNELLSDVSKLPAKERQLIELTRNVNLNQTILEALQTRKLEFSIIEASTLSDVNVIDSAYNFRQVAPSHIINLAMGFLIGLLLGMAYVYWRVLIEAKLTSPQRVTDVVEELKSLGLVPNIKKGEKISDIEAGERELINSMLSAFYIEQKGISGNVILVTGCLSGIGKSFISKVLAEILATDGKKVALIDTDYRRGKLYKDYGFSRSSHISLNDEIDLTNSKTEIENLYLVTGFKEINQSTFTLYDSAIFRGFIERAKQNFDYVIIDTAPSLMVSDSLMITQYSDMIVHIVRHNQTRERELLDSFNLISAIGKFNHFFIYNDFKRSAGSYLYNYYSHYQSRYYGNYYYGENNAEPK